MAGKINNPDNPEATEYSVPNFSPNPKTGSKGRARALMRAQAEK